MTPGGRFENNGAAGKYIIKTFFIFDSDNFMIILIKMALNANHCSETYLHEWMKLKIMLILEIS